MAKSKHERNVVGEHMRAIAIKVAAEKVRRACLYAAQASEAHVMMLFGNDSN